jgi:hypothetical protein
MLTCGFVRSNFFFATCVVYLLLGAEWRDGAQNGT